MFVNSYTDNDINVVNFLNDINVFILSPVYLCLPSNLFLSVTQMWIFLKKFFNDFKTGLTEGRDTLCALVLQWVKRSKRGSRWYRAVGFSMFSSVCAQWSYLAQNGMHNLPLNVAPPHAFLPCALPCQSCCLLP